VDATRCHTRGLFRQCRTLELPVCKGGAACRWECQRYAVAAGYREPQGPVAGAGGRDVNANLAAEHGAPELRRYGCLRAMDLKRDNSGEASAGRA
jgi:hypothetical protein